MRKTDAENCVDEVMEAIDDEIAEALTDVAVYVVDGRDDPELAEAIRNAGMERAPIRADFRGLYLGTVARPAPVVGDDDDDAIDAGAEYVPQIPRGSIVVNCRAVSGLAEVRDTMAHEIGHALGMTEAEVEDLGLG